MTPDLQSSLLTSVTSRANKLWLVCDRGVPFRWQGAPRRSRLAFLIEGEGLFVSDICTCPSCVAVRLMHKPVDSTAAILNAIVDYIDQDKNRLSEEARQALARVNGAVARQDKRFK